jgi:hypothetical protein
MRNKSLLLFLIGIIVALTAAQASLARAQVADSTWSVPFRLSDRNNSATEATLVADEYGYVHVFWGEVLPDDRAIIKYSRFDGGVWSVPISVYIGPEDFTFDSISPFIGNDGRLYVYWTEGVLLKNIRLSSVPVLESLSIDSWAPVSRVQILSKDMRVVEDSLGNHHIIFNRIDPAGRGLYYIKSSDRGSTWTSPVWLDPDLPPDLTPTNLNMAVDDEDQLHIVWGYVVLDQAGPANNWIRYGRMDTATGAWTTATIVRIDPEDTAADYKLTAAGPVMALSGNELVVIWAGGFLHYRHFRHSSDGGLSWSTSVRLFGELNGQAFDGMAIDGSGRVHYFAQIRFPVGIYHSIWDGSRWTTPSLVYFIRYGSVGGNSGNVEAHAVHPAIRAGNQIVLTFTDPPGNARRGVYAMTTTLSDVDPVPVSAPPTAQAIQPSVPPATGTAVIGAAAATPTPAPAVTTTNVPTPFGGDDLNSTSPISPSSNTALIFGMLLSMLVLGIIITIRIIARR